MGPEDPYSPGLTNPSAGIQLHSAQAFQMEGNKIKDSLPPLSPLYFGYGINVNSTGLPGKSIYRNSVSGIYRSIGAQQENQGLVILCNNIKDYYRGISSFGSPTINHGIYKFQGRCTISGPMVGGLSAGNVFGNAASYDLNNSENQSASNDIEYHHDAINIPTYDIIVPTITLNQCEEENECNSRIISSNPPASEISGLISYADNIGQAISTTTGDDQEVYRHAFDEAINRAQMATAMQSDTLDSLEVDIYKWDEVIDLFELKEGYTGFIDPHHIELLIRTGELNQAQEMLENYENQLGENLDNYGEFLSTLIYLFDNSFSENNINSTAENALRDISENEYKYGYTQSLEILKTTRGEDYELLYVAPPEDSPERQGHEIKDEPLQNTSFDIRLNVFPNPISDLVVIECNIPLEAKQWKILIHNSLGVKIEIFELSPGENIIETRNLSGSGIYHVTLIDHEGLVIQNTSVSKL